MESAVEKRLQGLLHQRDSVAGSPRELLFSDVLLLQLAKDVGAPLRGVYDGESQLRAEEIALRIRKAELEPAEKTRSHLAAPSRRRSSRVKRRTWVWAGLILGPISAIAAISALAVRLGLLPGL